MFCSSVPYISYKIITLLQDPNTYNYSLDNEIMNSYYEARMPSHTKPQQSTNVEVVKKFIKDKYVKKLWIDTDEEDPVTLYLNGEFGKEKKKPKKEKKEKKEKKKDKKKDDERKKKVTKEVKQDNGPDLIDFAGDGDDFGDFQDGVKEVKSKSMNDDFGDLIGGNDNDDFGDFVTPENNKHEDDFEGFMSADNNPLHSSDSFHTAPPAPSSSHTSFGNQNLLNNLSSLYSQSKPTHDPTNKYAALENLGQQFPQQPSSDMFFGMNFHNNGFSQHQPQHQTPSAFDAFPTLTHQHSYPGPSQDTNLFAPPSFPTANMNSTYEQRTGFTQPPTFTHTHSSGHHHNFSTPPTSHYTYNTSSSTQNLPKPNGGYPKQEKDMFGLKATLMQNNKYGKYTGSSGMGKQANKTQDTSAFSSLVSTQWH
jgi:hypothetical protein